MLRQSSKTVVREVMDNRWLRWLIILVFLIVATWVVGQVGSFLLQYLDTFLLFFIAWLLAFTLRPFAEMLQAVNLPRRNHPIGWVGAVNLVYLGVLLALGLLGWLIMPPLVDQINNLVKFLGDQNQLAGFRDWALLQLQNFGIQSADVQNFINNLSAQALDFTRQIVTFLQGLFGVVFNVIIILVLSYIFMSDGKRIAEGLRNVVPLRYRDQTRLLGSSIESSFGGFLRGQFLMGIVYGTMVGIVLAVFRLNFALLAAIVTTLFMLVPLIGYVAAYVPPVLIAIIDSLLSGHPTSLAGANSWWIILIIVVVVQALILNVVAPRIMSESVGVHPLVVFAAMLLGSKIGGVWGALFGIPVAGVINVMTGQFFNSFIKPSAWFNSQPSGWQVVESVEEQERIEATDTKPTDSLTPSVTSVQYAGGNITITDPSGDDQITRTATHTLTHLAVAPISQASIAVDGSADKMHADEAAEAEPIGARK